MMRIGRGNLNYLLNTETNTSQRMTYQNNQMFTSTDEKSCITGPSMVQLPTLNLQISANYFKNYALTLPNYSKLGVQPLTERVNRGSMQNFSYRKSKINLQSIDSKFCKTPMKTRVKDELISQRSFSQLPDDVNSFCESDEELTASIKKSRIGGGSAYYQEDQDCNFLETEEFREKVKHIHKSNKSGLHAQTYA
jgi:hypothetical protein